MSISSQPLFPSCGGNIFRQGFSGDIHAHDHFGLGRLRRLAAGAVENEEMAVSIDQVKDEEDESTDDSPENKWSKQTDKTEVQI